MLGKESEKSNERPHREGNKARGDREGKRSNEGMVCLPMEPVSLHEPRSAPSYLSASWSSGESSCRNVA